MRKNRFLAAPVLALALAVGACDQGLTDINDNPNAPEAVPGEYLLANAIVDAVGSNPHATHGVWYGLYMTDIWSQHVAQSQYNDEDRYTPRESQITGIWDEAYTGPLADLKLVKKVAETDGDDNLFAVGEILSQWIFQHLTDAYGDIPYSEALKGDEGIRLPRYDAQEDVYEGMLAALTAASARIDAGADASFEAGDLIYHGDMEKWRRFANSLRLRMAMRMSNVSATFARDQFVAAFNAGVFQSNADNAVLQWGAEVPSQNPIYDYYINQDRGGDFVISATIVDSLAHRDDPRLAVFADLSDDGVYRGLPNGTLPGDYELPEGATFSQLGSYFLEPDAPSVIMSYAEVQFLLAEAAARGWIGGSPAAYYQAGIRASMEQYGIDEAAITGYLAQPEVFYNGLPSIYFQKWVALFMTGAEAWAEVRRTGFPALTPTRGSEIPARIPYPNQEQLYNPTNWTAAGGENVTLFDNLWWDPS
ncbi:MAG TPA: SusD/RagB family nutrient-binding outer membrane lipoprotein [Longimicrobium sp.]|nr:SusD/RagB family nutrient-binding outer membrane lipoprotein [Longimicrobium sp.]